MATGDILACRIASAARDNGWIAEIDIDNLAIGGSYTFGLGAKNDPSAAKIALTVTSPGYDATGVLGSIVRTVYGTMWERKAQPNQAVADEVVVSTTLTVRVALSDFIYAGDTVTAVIGGGFYTKTAVPNNARASFSVTNNSTLTHPKCVGRWAWPGWDLVTGAFTLEACIYHRSAKGGKPVAAVIFSVFDGTTTVNATATAMSVSAINGATGTGKVIVYKADFNASSFAQGTVLTCNFTAYPWVGDAGATLTSASGITPPDERLCPLKLLCDKTGAYGGACAVVDATNGHASAATTWVAASQTAAETAYGTLNTNSYTTIGFAVQALTAFNNASKGHNNPGGAVILLTGNHNWDVTSPAGDQGAMDAWVTITRLSTKTRAQCVINNGGGSGLNTQKVKVTDVTASGAITGQIKSSSIATNVVWVDNCDLNLTGLAPIYQWRMSHLTRCSVTALAGGARAFSTDVSPCAMVRGNAFPLAAGDPGLVAEAYCMLGNKNFVPVFVWGNDKLGAGQQTSDNGVVAYNQTYFNNNFWCTMDNTVAVTAGVAIIQNVVEKINNDGQQLASVYGDNCAAASSNILMWHNTFAGERLNNGYNDIGAAAFLHKCWSQIGNIFEAWNNKDDTFTGTPNAARVGSWPVGYAVGHRGNFRRTANLPEWLGEFLGIYSVTAGALGFVSDRSNNNGGGGSGAGGGNYHLTTGGTSVGLALLNAAVLPFDLDGNARALTNGDVGAFESQVTATVASKAASRHAQMTLDTTRVRLGHGHIRLG